MTEKGPKQLLHLVFGGELEDLDGTDLQGPVEARHRRHLSQLRRRAGGLEGEGAGDGG